MSFKLESTKIGIIGLGYVGLPLAVEFGKVLKTVGFDISHDRINELSDCKDSTLECSSSEIESARDLTFSYSLEDLKDCNVYVITVPTPIDEHNQPDLSPLIKSSMALGRIISKGDIVIYESTVYPGATEEECIPVIEHISGLVFNCDFYAGYSPERINPGDKEHRLPNIKKVTSGSTAEVADFIDELYKKIIVAGTHKAPSIKVAEASKVVENVQRDVNIALINELHQIFTKLKINTDEVIDAASTKWNFMKLSPGMVGGHCIGVDPYYLLQKATETGYVPDLIRQSRDINNGMPSFLAQDFLRELISNRISPIDCKVSLLGFTFKENCPDIRNTKVYDLYLELVNLGFDVSVVDPWANKEDVMIEYGISISSDIPNDTDVFFLAVGHNTLLTQLELVKGKKYIYDYKRVLKKH